MRLRRRWWQCSAVEQYQHSRQRGKCAEPVVRRIQRFEKNEAREQLSGEHNNRTTHKACRNEGQRRRRHEFSLSDIVFNLIRRTTGTGWESQLIARH
jgi:hypothetical protein